MSNQLSSHIIQEVKDFLQLEGELSAEELYDNLFNYRNSVHPDKYLDSEAKKEAEEAFKKCGNYLERLLAYIKQENLNKKPSDLIPYKEKHETIWVKNELLLKDKEIESLKLHLSLAKHKISELKGQLRAIASQKVKNLTETLQGAYKDKTSFKFGYITAGVLSAAYLLFGRATQIRDVLAKYAPFDMKYLDGATFLALCYILGLAIKRAGEYQAVRNLIERVKDPEFIRAFYKNYVSEEKNKHFREHQVATYIKKSFGPQNKVLKSILRVFSSLYSTRNMNNLKDQFISNLIDKQLIEIADAEELDRIFKPKSRSYYGFDEDDF